MSRKLTGRWEWIKRRCEDLQAFDLYRRVDENFRTHTRIIIRRQNHLFSFKVFDKARQRSAENRTWDPKRSRVAVGFLCEGL